MIRIAIIYQNHVQDIAPEIQKAIDNTILESLRPCFPAKLAVSFRAGGRMNMLADRLGYTEHPRDLLLRGSVHITDHPYNSDDFHNLAFGTFGFDLIIILPRVRFIDDGFLEWMSWIEQVLSNADRQGTATLAIDPDEALLSVKRESTAVFYGLMNALFDSGGYKKDDISEGFAKCLCSLLAKPILKTIGRDDIAIILKHNPSDILDIIARPGKRIPEIPVTPPFIFHAFLSHTGRDHSSAELTEFLALLSKTLQAYGVEIPPVFLDRVVIGKWKGAPGDLEELLRESMVRSCCTIALLSPSYTSSRWCRFEVRTSIKCKSQIKGRFVFPLIWESISPLSRFLLRLMYSIRLSAHDNSSAKIDFLNLQNFVKDRSYSLAQIVFDVLQQRSSEFKDIDRHTITLHEPRELCQRFGGDLLHSKLLSYIKECSPETYSSIQRWHRTVESLIMFVRDASAACSTTDNDIILRSRFSDRTHSDAAQFLSDNFSRFSG